MNLSNVSIPSLTLPPLILHHRKKKGAHRVRVGEDRAKKKNYFRKNVKNLSEREKKTKTEKKKKSMTSVLSEYGYRNKSLWILGIAVIVLGFGFFYLSSSRVEEHQIKT